MASAPSIELGPLGLENPMGTDGFEFVEYAAPDPDLLRSLFAKMGFPAVATHKRKNVTLHRQGDINFIINAEPNSFAERFASEHGPCACAMAFRSRMRRRHTPARLSLARPTRRATSPRASSTFRQSRASAGRGSIWSIAMAAQVRSTTSISISNQAGKDKRPMPHRT